jgi:hypothetical protein
MEGIARFLVINKTFLQLRFLAVCNAVRVLPHLTSAAR